MDDQVNDDAQQTQDDQTEGVVEPTTTDQAQAEPATQPKVEPDATTDRFKQDNAVLRQTLIKLGIDPDSSDAEAIRQGYIDPKDFLAAKYGQPTANQPANQPELTLQQKIQKLQQSIESVNGQVSVEDYQNQLSTTVDVLNSLMQENVNLKQGIQQDQAQRVFDNCMNSCRTTYQSNDTFNSLAPEIQAQAAQFIESATDVAVGKLAQQIGYDRVASPQVYQKETAKVLQQFESLIGALQGKPQATHPAGQPQAVAPVVMGQGPGQPISTPQPTMKLEDLRSNVDKYLANQRLQV